MSNQGVSYKVALLILCLIFLTGLGILIWLSLNENLNETQAALKDIADWMIKTSLGAIFGWVGGSRLGGGSGGSS